MNVRSLVGLAMVCAMSCAGAARADAPDTKAEQASDVVQTYHDPNEPPPGGTAGTFGFWQGGADLVRNTMDIKTPDHPKGIVTEWLEKRGVPKPNPVGDTANGLIVHFDGGGRDHYTGCEPAFAQTVPYASSTAVCPQEDGADHAAQAANPPPSIEIPGGGTLVFEGLAKLEGQPDRLHMAMDYARIDDLVKRVNQGGFRAFTVTNYYDTHLPGPVPEYMDAISKNLYLRLQIAHSANDPEPWIFINSDYWGLISTAETAAYAQASGYNQAAAKGGIFVVGTCFVGDPPKIGDQLWGQGSPLPATLGDYMLRVNTPVHSFASTLAGFCAVVLDQACKKLHNRSLTKAELKAALQVPRTLSGSANGPYINLYRSLEYVENQVK